MPYQVDPTTVPDTVAIYSPPKVGKTRLVAAACRGAPERFGEEAIYIAADPKSEALESVMTEDRQRLHVYKPYPADPEKRVMGKGWDPIKEWTELATTDWKAIHPNVGCIIADTFTQGAKDFRQQIAFKGNAPANSADGTRPQWGTKGEASYIVLPSRSDTFSGQMAAENILRLFFEQPLPFIATFHQALRMPDDSGKAVAVVGGPATVGTASVESVAGAFSHVIRLSKSQNALVAKSRDHGVWLAGIRSGHAAPMADVALAPDPINFWERYEEFKR